MNVGGRENIELRIVVISSALRVWRREIEEEGFGRASAAKRKEYWRTKRAVVIGGSERGTVGRLGRQFQLKEKEERS